MSDVSASDLPENLKRVRDTILEACERSQRKSSEVSLVAVSKTKPIELIRAASDAGQKIFGENYVQEAVDKITAMPELEWHFIGSLQSNKAKQVAGKFTLVHSVDRLKLAQALNSAAAAAGVIQRCLLEIQIGDEATKHGFSLDEAPSILAEIASFKNLAVEGLMSLPPIEESEMKARKHFAQLRNCLENWRSQLPPDAQARFRTLSMGTSSDYVAAILEGATLVRVGTSLFGARKLQ